MWRLVPILVREMGQAYPELARAEALIAETLRLEEHASRNTLERGLSILDEESRSLGRVISSRARPRSRSTNLGFPLDLTQDALRPRGIAVDTEGFNAAMERQREKARASWSGSGDAATEAVWLRCGRASAPPNSLATRPRPPRAWLPHSSGTARKSMP